MAANVFDADWDAERNEEPFRWRRARLARQAGCEALGASVFELPPGAATFALHFHHANEELIVVLAGEPTLETLDGEERLDAGEVVACPAGRRGAHRIRNQSAEAARILILSTMRSPEITEFPETGELWVRDYPPGAEPPAGALDQRLCGDRAAAKGPQIGEPGTRPTPSAPASTRDKPERVAERGSVAKRGQSCSD